MQTFKSWIFSMGTKLFNMNQNRAQRDFKINSGSVHKTLDYNKCLIRFFTMIDRIHWWNSSRSFVFKASWHPIKIREQMNFTNNLSIRMKKVERKSTQCIFLLSLWNLIWREFSLTVFFQYNAKHVFIARNVLSCAVFWEQLKSIKCCGVVKFVIFSIWFYWWAIFLNLFFTQYFKKSFCTYLMQIFLSVHLQISSKHFPYISLRHL